MKFVIKASHIKHIIVNPMIYLAILLYKKDYLLIKLTLSHLYEKNKATGGLDCTILSNLLISGEDHRFKYHPGFDVLAIVRAIRNRILYNKREGASTIEQQLVRVIINDFDKSLQRKLKEIVLATTLKTIVPRKVIPSIYLQIAYYGTNLNGLESVLIRFKSNRETITEEIAAEIIARIKYPEPKRLTQVRAEQIQRRKRHLLFLYQKHSARNIIKVYG